MFIVIYRNNICIDLLTVDQWLESTNAELARDNF